MRTKILLIAVSILIITISGCTDNSKDQNSSTPVPVETSENTSTVQELRVGQSIKDDNTRMTLNSLRFTKTIDEKNNKSSISISETGNQFLILNITIENVGKDKNISYPVSQFVLFHNEEEMEKSPSVIDSFASSNLKEVFNGDNIIPGDKRQGEIAFLVSEGERGLMLGFEYSPESSKGSTMEFFTLDE